VRTATVETKRLSACPGLLVGSLPKLRAGALLGRDSYLESTKTIALSQCLASHRKIVMTQFVLLFPGPCAFARASLRVRRRVYVVAYSDRSPKRRASLFFASSVVQVAVVVVKSSRFLLWPSMAVPPFFTLQIYWVYSVPHVTALVRSPVKEGMGKDTSREESSQKIGRNDPTDHPGMRHTERILRVAWHLPVDGETLFIDMSGKVDKAADKLYGDIEQFCFL
jgi:hypothetical protein